MENGFYIHIVKMLSSCVRTEVLAHSLLIWGFYGTSIPSLLQTNHISSPGIARKWTIVVSCTSQRGQVYMKPINTHIARLMTVLLLCVQLPRRWGDTASVVYLRYCCLARRKWITNADGPSSPTKTHQGTFRSLKKKSSATQVLDVFIRWCVLFW